MERVRRALSLLVLFGAVIPATTGCASLGDMCGLLIKAAIAVGLAVGTYYLIQELD